MHQIYKDFSERFDNAHKELQKILDVLPDTAVDWVPGDGMNSLAVLISHIAGSGRFWVGDMAREESSERVRQAEFEASGVTTAALKQRLDESMVYIQEALTKFSIDDLAQMRTSSSHEHSFSVGWCLLHALEHTSEHVGHLQMLCQLWEARHK